VEYDFSQFVAEGVFGFDGHCDCDYYPPFGDDDADDDDHDDGDDVDIDDNWTNGNDNDRDNVG
jgi:hypothetical protein